MVRYTAKRLLTLIPVMIGITFIVFSIMELSPGDPVAMMLGDKATEETIHAKREELGLNDPFLMRYLRFVGNVARGDFGHTYASNRSVSEAIFTRLPVTLRIAVFSIIIVVAVGIPIGVLSATMQYSLLDISSMVFAMLLSAVPGFWLGLMLILLFSVQLGWLPSFGMSGFKSMIMPSLTLSLHYVAIIIRVTRTTMLEVIRQDYIRTARAKGAAEPYIIRKHALKNAMIPIITSVGMFFGGMLAGAVIVESVFAIPGVGTLLIGGIQSKDMPTVLGCVTVLALSFCLINLCVDLLYGAIDPRIKSQYGVMKKFKRAKVAEK